MYVTLIGKCSRGATGVSVVVVVVAAPAVVAAAAVVVAAAVVAPAAAVVATVAKWMLENLTGTCSTFTSILPWLLSSAKAWTVDVSWT